MAPPSGLKSHLQKVVKDKEKLEMTSQIKIDANRMLTNKNEGNKYLTMKRVDEKKTQKGVSPFLIEKCVINIIGTQPEEMKLLKNGPYSSKQPIKTKMYWESHHTLNKISCKEYKKQNEIQTIRTLNRITASEQ